jgi:hypothetical protein
VARRAPLVRAASDLGGVHGGERLHLAVAPVEVEGLRVGRGERVVGRRAARGWVVAAGVEEEQHLADAGLAYPVFDLDDVDRRLLQQVHVVAHLRVRGQEERLIVALDAVAGEGEEQQPVLRHDAGEVRELAQDVAARRLPVGRAVGGEQQDLIGGEARVAHQGVGEQARVVGRGGQPRDLRVGVLIDADDERVTLLPGRQRADRRGRVLRLRRLALIDL